MIIIVSKTYKLTNEFISLKDEIKIIDSEVEIIDDAYLKHNGELINYDYLISDDYTLLNNINNAHVLLDDLKPLTNFYQQTSIDNIYYGNIDISIKHILKGDE